ncbi:hypothetical protein [Vibrio kanaloae]|uniref:hypothetical protein n=1 Tax=Vibrio kanaloae TaxID=170673 RepID=UPI0012488C3E|nr:hypothetical protein [Vibrio kanaloae]KAB0463165.1 hypothetical protein F7Q89_14800 [Vibrio kanaloae]
MTKDKNRTVSEIFLTIARYLNQRPILTALIVVTIILDVIWLNYANFYSRGLTVYFERRPEEAFSIVGVAIFAIVILVKKVDK